MTLKEVEALSDHELRLKVAELCGWTVKPCTYTESGYMYWNDELDKSRPDDDDGIRFELPDYTGSLDAMHEAEKILDTDKMQDAYLVALEEFTGADYGLKDFEWRLCNSTAKDRAKAFVLAMTRGE